MYVERAKRVLKYGFEDPQPISSTADDDDSVEISTTTPTADTISPAIDKAVVTAHTPKAPVESRSTSSYSEDNLESAFVPVIATEELSIPVPYDEPSEPNESNSLMLHSVAIAMSASLTPTRTRLRLVQSITHLL